MAKKNERVKVENIEKALDQDERVELWLTKNWKVCLAAVLVVTIALVVAFTLYIKHNENIRKASIALAEAEPENLPAMIAENPDTPGVSIARLRLAQYLFVEKKDYISAENVFNQIAADTALPSEIRNNARVSAALCMAQNNKVQEACDALIAISNDSTVSQTIQCEAIFQAARLFLNAKELARAEELLKGLAEMEIPADNSVPGSVQMCKMYAQMLLAQLRNGDFN